MQEAQINPKKEKVNKIILDYLEGFNNLSLEECVDKIHKEYTGDCMDLNHLKETILSNLEEFYNTDRKAFLARSVKHEGKLIFYYLFHKKSSMTESACAKFLGINVSTFHKLKSRLDHGNLLIGEVKKKFEIWNS